MSYEDVSRILVEEYEKVIEVAKRRYGEFTEPFLYIPELNERFWEEHFFPEGGKRKSYAWLTRIVETGEIVISCNTWLFLRDLKEFGEGNMRRLASATLCHEMVHHVKRDWLELDVNVEGEKLFREIYPPRF